MFMSSWLQLCIYPGADWLKTSITQSGKGYSLQKWQSRTSVLTAGALWVLYFSVQDLQDSLLGEMKLLIHVGCWIRECCRNCSGPVNVWWEKRETSMECLLFILQNKLPQGHSAMLLQLETVYMISPNCISEKTWSLIFTGIAMVITSVSKCI